MSVWAKANEARGREEAAAAWGVRDMQRGDADMARYFFELAAAHRAVRYEFEATGRDIEDLRAARLVELRRRVLNRPQI